MIRLGYPSGVAYLEETLLLSVILIHTYTLSTSLSLSRQRSFSASHHSSHRIVLCSAYYYIRRSLWSLSSFCRTVPCFFPSSFTPLYPFLCPSLTFCLFLHFYPSTLLLLLKRSLFVLPDWMHEYTSVFYSSLVQHHPQIHKIPLATFELLHPFLPTYLPTLPSPFYAYTTTPLRN